MPVVRWEYYTPNEDREEAAREALAEMRNPDSTCNLFTVREDVGTDEYTRVDLAEATRSGSAIGVEIDPEELSRLPEHSVVMDRDYDTYIVVGGIWYEMKEGSAGEEFTGGMGDYNPYYLLRRGEYPETRSVTVFRCDKEHLEDHSCEDNCNLRHMDDDHDCLDNAYSDGHDCDEHCEKEHVDEFHSCLQNAYDLGHECEEECGREHANVELSLYWKQDENGGYVRDPGGGFAIDMERTVFTSGGETICHGWEVPRALIQEW